MKTSDILRNSIIFLMFSVLFVPLIFSNQFFFPYISAKNFTFRALVEVASCLYVLLILWDRAYRPTKSKIVAALVAFLGVMAIATFTSEYPYKSFWGNYERMEGYITVLHLGAYFIILASVFRVEKIWEWFFEISLLASLFVGINALTDLGKGITRIYGSLGNSTYLGVYALVHVFLAALLLFKYIEHSHKQSTLYGMRFYKYIGYILFNIYIVYQTGTRGSFLGLIAGVLVISILIALFEKERKVLRKVSVGILIATVVVVALLGATKNTTFVKQSMLGRYANLVTFDVMGVIRDQGFGRTLIWNVALQGVKERPILGWGQESFNYVFNKYYTPDLYSQEQWFDRAHNVFLDWLVAGGILGLLAYLSLYATFLWSVWQSSKTLIPVPAKAIITGLVAAYFVHNLFVFDNLASYILFFALLGYGHHLLAGERKHTGPLSKGVLYTVGTIVIVVFAGVIYIATIKPFQANLVLLSALEKQAEFTQDDSPRKGQPVVLSEMYDSFQKVFSYNTFGTPEAREQLAQVSQGLFASAGTENQKKLFDLVNSEFSKQLMATPKDARYYSIYGTFLGRVGDLNNALVNIRKAEALSPGKQQFMFDEGIVLINQKKYEDAFKVLQNAYKLDPSYTQAQSMYAIAAVYDRQDAVFNELAKINPGFIADSKVIQAYVVTKQIPKAISLIENYIANNKTVPSELRFYLAAAYLENGQRASALAVLNSMLADPTNASIKAEISYYIDLINKGTTSFLQ